MDKVFIDGLMVGSMLVDIMKIKNKDLECIIGWMGGDLRDNGVKEREMGLGS